MFLRHIHAMLNRERTITRTIGDVQLETTERGRRITNFKLNHGSGVPDLLARFSPEVQEQARSYRWSSSRERGLLAEAKKAGPLAVEVVKQVILHDRAVIIERALQRKAERQGPRQAATMPEARPVTATPARAEPDYVALRAAGWTASEIYALHRGVHPVQPLVDVASRTRSR
jgi:hypothetical protein